MTKKDRKSKEFNDREIESAATDSEENTGESASFESSPEEESVNTPSEEQGSDSTEKESSSDDLLDDVRRSLIEEDETDQTKKQTKWWRRLGRKEKRALPDPPPPIVEIDLPPTSLQNELVGDQNQATEPDEYEEQIDDLLDMLKSEHQASEAETPSVAADVEIPPEPEQEIDFEQLKQQAFRPRAAEEEVQSDSDVRSIALDGGEEVFVEVETQAVDPFEERIKSIENVLKPYRSYIYMLFTFLGIVMAGLAFFLIFNVYNRPEPEKEVSNLPYPIAVSLPGGWSFNLGRGTLQGGKWEPGGAEWLEGPEVCRWVSLPCSRQLEAVIRTLNPNDPIELTMSNNDKLVYSVYAVHEMTPEEIQKLDAGSPCLLLILTESDSEKRWVLTALP